MPSDFELTGWYEGGPRPGEAGPAVIVGHVDSYRAPAVFARLDDLADGERVIVDYSDGTEVAFRVYDRAQYPKDRFPASTVYSNTDRAELRLITCGGRFDRSTRHYRENIVVWAAAE